MFARRRDVLEGEADRLGGLAVRGDVTVPADLERLVERTLEAFGGIDIVVHNSGGPPRTPALEMNEENIEATVQLLLVSAVRLTALCLPHLERSEHGRIVTITSVVGATGNPGQMNYAAAKAGLTGMTKSLAQELATRGVTANCVAPGFIRTAMTDVLPDAQKDALNARIPAGRMGEGEEIGAAVAFLASKEAAYVTGQTIHVNGGMAMLS